MWRDSNPETALVPSSAELADTELCAIARAGETWPIGVLWQRHHAVVLGWARRKDAAAAEDAVSDAFDQIFRALIAGGGPQESFRSYLFRTVNTQLSKRWDSQRRGTPLDDLDFEDLDALPAEERTADAEEQLAAADALRELPDRWQEVILAVDVEGRPVQEVAEQLGLTANSTSVLLKRAREGLRKSWLTRMHPARDLPDECRTTTARFNDIRWGKRNTRRRHDAETHLRDCPDCRKRWVLFVERASVIGLVSAGIIALTKEWRSRVAVPTLAAVSTASLLTASVITLGPALAPSLDRGDTTALELQEVDPTRHVPVEQGSASASASADAASNANGATWGTDSGSRTNGREQTTDGTDPRAAASSDSEARATSDAAASARAGARAASDADTDGGPAADASSSAGANAGADANGGADADPEPRDALYFGDWDDWCEQTQSFSAPC